MAFLFAFFFDGGAARFSGRFNETWEKEKKSRPTMYGGKWGGAGGN